MAHLDRDPARSGVDDLVFLCQACHTQYDKESNRVLGFTPNEARHYRDRLHAALGHDLYELTITVRVDHSRLQTVRGIIDDTHATLLALTRDVTRSEGPAKP